MEKSLWIILIMPGPVRALLEGKADRGILICGSGVGASVAANKFPGIRAGLCHDTFSAHQGVEDDDMNVLCLGARVVGPELAKDIAGAFLDAVFSRANGMCAGSEKSRRSRKSAGEAEAANVNQGRISGR